MCGRAIGGNNQKIHSKKSFSCWSKSDFQNNFLRYEKSEKSLFEISNWVKKCETNFFLKQMHARSERGNFCLGSSSWSKLEKKQVFALIKKWKTDNRHLDFGQKIAKWLFFYMCAPEVTFFFFCCNQMMRKWESFMLFRFLIEKQLFRKPEKN